MESKLNRKFDPELKYKIQSKFPMTSRLLIFNLQKLNLCANISFWFFVLLFDYWIFSGKDIEREQIRIKPKIQQKVPSRTQACIFFISTNV